MSELNCFTLNILFVPQFPEHKKLNNFSAFCHIHLQQKVTENFQIGLVKEMCSDQTKTALGKKYLEKNFENTFSFFSRLI